MFENNEYQIKDVMKLYGITRDAVKYYESVGLIESKRKENGYRYFDELNVQKLKKILSFRDLGMTVEEIIKHCNSESSQERLELLFQVRRRTEDEIMRLHNTLNKIRRLEQRVVETPRFQNEFNVDRNVTLCVNCQYITTEKRRSFLVTRALKAEYLEERKDWNILNCELIKDDDLKSESCTGCKNMLSFKTCFRYRAVYEDMKKLKELLSEEYHTLETLGYQPCKIIYVMRKVLKMNGIDHIILDIVMPIEDYSS